MNSKTQTPKELMKFLLMFQGRDEDAREIEADFHSLFLSYAPLSEKLDPVRFQAPGGEKLVVLPILLFDEMAQTHSLVRDISNRLKASHLEFSKMPGNEFRSALMALTGKEDEPEDIAAFDAAVADAGPTLDEAQLNRILDGESPLRVWRDAAGLTQKALADKVGVSQSYIADLERGAKEGGIRVWKAMAEAIGVTIDDLV